MQSIAFLEYLLNREERDLKQAHNACGQSLSRIFDLSLAIYVTFIATTTVLHCNRGSLFPSARVVTFCESHTAPNFTAKRIFMPKDDIPF